MNSRSASPVPQFTENKPIPLKHRAYEEIGASFNGNEVKIRVPKTKYKAPKLNSSQIKLENACTCAYKEDLTCRNCDMDSDKYGPQNTVDVHLPDDLSEAIINRNRYNSEIVYNMQRNLENICKTCNITPKNAPKGVAVLKKIHEDKDIFILKIGKQTDEPKRTGNIEECTFDKEVDVDAVDDARVVIAGKTGRGVCSGEVYSLWSERGPSCAARVNELSPPILDPLPAICPCTLRIPAVIGPAPA